MTSALWAGAATLAAPGLRVMLRRRARRGKELAARLPEREGIDPTPRPSGMLLWLHAASVGESLSVLPVVAALLHDKQPTVLLTTGTVTSARLLEGRLPAFGGRVLHRFVPLDVPAWAARFLDHWRPDAAAFVESELWPNLLAGCRRRAIPAMLLNARMSAQSFRGWSRTPAFARQVLGSFTQVHPQSAADAERLRHLGANGIGPAANLKHAAAPLAFDTAELTRLHDMVGPRPLWVAASTHPGEEDVAASVHRRLMDTHPGLLTIVAPRHPDRGPHIAAGLAARLGPAVPVTRRGAGQGPPQGGVWIVDTMGELGLLYRLSRIAFVGRSLVGQGGQNPWEPARLGCAVGMGPHTGNFTDAVVQLTSAGALTVVQDEAALAAWVDGMLTDAEAREAAGQAGIAATAGDVALPARLAEALRAMLGP